MKINKGTATKGSLIMVPKTLCGKKPIIRKLKISRASPINAKINAEPASVNATGKPNNNNPRVVKNMMIERISGVMNFPYLVKLEWT
jgi:hypothetical protein